MLKVLQDIARIGEEPDTATSDNLTDAVSECDRLTQILQSKSADESVHVDNLHSVCYVFDCSLLTC